MGDERLHLQFAAHALNHSRCHGDLQCGVARLRYQVRPEEPPAREFKIHLKRGCIHGKSFYLKNLTYRRDAETHGTGPSKYSPLP